MSYEPYQLSQEQIDDHKRYGHPKHVPAILHRTGGISARQLNVCGVCGVNLVDIYGAGLEPVSPEVADAMRKHK